MYIVIVGAMFKTKTVYGPFENFDHADQWVTSQDWIVKEQYHYEIVPLLQIQASKLKWRKAYKTFSPGCNL